MAYSTQAQVELRFGAANVRKWADLNNELSTAEIAARVASAIADADAEIDAIMLGGPYTVPFADSPPAMIQQISAALAGCNLYAARGAADVDDETGEPINRLFGVRSHNIAQLRGLKAGIYRLAETVNVSMSPIAIETEVNRDTERPVGSP